LKKDSKPEYLESFISNHHS